MDDYYTAPSQEIFDDIKTNSIKIRNIYDNTYGYATEKINKVSSMDNIRDNTYFIIAMFDLQNQAKLRKLI
jgi:hypothetical protein